jgi:uncharacterized protein YggE
MRLAILLLAASATAFGQLDDDTLTVTATRTTSLAPDQAAITIYFSGPAASSLDDALAALQGSGVAASDLAYVTSTDGASPFLQWVFNRTVSFSQLKATLAALDSIQSAVAKKGAFSVSWFVQGTVSPAAQQATALCPLPAMVSDARAQAQRVADAAGVKVGPVVSLSQAQPGGLVPVPVFRSGEFVSATGFVSNPFRLGVISSSPPPTGSSCGITVQFKLLR